MAETEAPPFPLPSNPNSPILPPELLLAERRDFAGVQISEIMYGITIVLFFHCMQALLFSGRTHRRRALITGYAMGLFALGTMFVGLNGYVFQLSFFDNRNFPEGGPEGYASSISSGGLVVTANASFIIANWLADSLLLFRCKIVWNTWWILVIPGIVYLASIGLGLMMIIITSKPSIWASTSVPYALPYFSVSVSLNILLTLLIAGRLMWHQRAVKHVANFRSSHGVPYNTIIGMLVESSAIYAVTSLLFIVPFAMHSSLALVFLPMLGQAQLIGPLLIIARVANQTAYQSSKPGPSGLIGSGDPSYAAGHTSGQTESYTLRTSPKASQYASETKTNVYADGEA